LQALVKLPYQIGIEIIEPNNDAQNLAKARLNEVEYDKSFFRITWNTSINKATSYDQLILKLII